MEHAAVVLQKLISYSLTALGKGELKVSSFTSKLRSFNRTELAALVFYIASGVVLLVCLPLTGYAPQLGLLGILSIIVAYGVFTKRVWAPWIIFILFVAATTFSLYTLVVAGFSNLLLGISMVAYVVLTWVFTIYLLLIRRKP